MSNKKYIPGPHQALQKQTNLALQALDQGDFVRAAEMGHQVIQQDPQFGEAWVVLCLALIRLESKDDERALRDALSALPTQTPASLFLQFELAETLSRRGRRDEAVGLARTLGQSPQLNAYQHDKLATVFQQSGLFDLALLHADKACALAPDDPKPRYNRGLVRRYLGSTTGALEDFERVIAQQPGHSLAHFSIADSRRWSPEENHIDRLKSALQSPSTMALDSVRLQFALFKECHDIGQTVMAWQALETANNTAAQLEPWPISARGERYRRILETRWPSPSEMRQRMPEKPVQTPIFILGLPRSGTTLVERILAAHSAVTPLGETQAFPVALQDLLDRKSAGDVIEDPQDLVNVDPNRLASAYLTGVRYLSGTTPFFTEKLPLNYSYVGAIKSAFPDARIIHLRRAPMDALFGAYKILFGRGSYLWSYSLDGLAEAYGYYRQIMDKWRNLLGDELIEVSLESLVADPEREIRTLLDLVGLPFETACLEPHKVSGGVATASTSQVRSPINAQGIGAWRRYADGLEPLRRNLQKLGYVDADGNPY